MQLENYSYHHASELEWLEREVTQHTSLTTALAFVHKLTGAPAMPTVVTQDEYTHDVTIRLRDDLYIAYGMT